MKSPHALEFLIRSLKILPNVGPKSAQRMAYHLLQHDRKGAQALAQALVQALENIHHCDWCNTFSETIRCPICADNTRQQNVLMLVHMPADMDSLEQAKCHDGLYFVLMGQVNPAQNMDLSAIELDKLVLRLAQSDINEVIIATNFTAEGDATAYVLNAFFQNLPYKVTRLARGMPLGGELEYIDSGTLAQAVYERRILKQSSD